MHYPESLHDDMTSGNAATPAQLSDDLGGLVTSLHTTIEDFRFAEGTPQWDSPDASTAFNVRAWATRAVAQVAQMRLARARLAISSVHRAYTAMEQDADALIRHWRGLHLTSSSVDYEMHRKDVVGHLLAVRASYSDALEAAREYLATVSLSAHEKAWLENGLARSLRFDLTDATDITGPAIPDTLLFGEDDGEYNPQGLGYDPDSRTLLQTSYSGENEHRKEDGDPLLPSRVSLMSGDTGAVTNRVELLASRGSDSKVTGHVGGIAVHDGVVLVTSGSKVYQYSLAEMRRAGLNEPVRPIADPIEVKAGSFATVSNGTLYVGDFDKEDASRMYAYSLGTNRGSGVLSPDPDYTQSYEVPSRTQGVAVVGGVAYYSRSYGAGEGDAKLQGYDLGSGEYLGGTKLPNMSEGVVATPGGLLTTFESGSEHYSDSSYYEDQELWASLNMSLTPYQDVGGQGTGVIEVDITSLDAAKLAYYRIGVQLEASELNASNLHLPAGALGNAPNARAFGSRFDDFLERTATWLDESRISADLTAEDLANAAVTYEHSDGAFGTKYLDPVRRTVNRTVRDHYDGDLPFVPLI